MKKVFFCGVILLFAGCSAPFLSSEKPERTSCTMEAMLCPDGSAVGRTGPNCEFEKCPEAGGPRKEYIGTSPEECSRIKFLCVPGKEYFADDKGCGCQDLPGKDEGKDTAKKCGIIGGEQIGCAEGEICAEFEGFSSEPRIRCLEEDFCTKYSPCPMGTVCTLAESWPVQIRCVPDNSGESTPSGNPDAPVSSGE